MGLLTKSLSSEVIKQAAEAPTSIAVEYKDKKITYSELASQMMHKASFFEEKGIYDEKILILKDKSDEIPTDILGIIHSGNAFVPLHAQWPDKQLMTVLSNTEARYIFTEERYLDRISEIAELVGVTLTVLISCSKNDYKKNNLLIENLGTPDFDKNINFPLKYNDKCYIYHTSGSTADAKEILGSQESVLHFIEWEKNEFKIDEKIRVSMLASITFDSVLRDIFLPLMSGGTICIPEDDVIYDSIKLAEFLHEKGITHIHTVPTLYRGWIGEIRTGMMPHLKYILLSGEPVESEDLRRCMKAFGGQVQLVNLYGATETCMIRFFYRLRPEDLEKSEIPVGFPLPDTCAKILNEEGRECAPGEAGEIHVITDHSTYGYLNNPNQNKKNFVKLDDIRAEYRSGDIGYLDEKGCLYCVGRKDYQVKVRGMKVNLKEIEEIINSYPEVMMSAVVTKIGSTGEKIIAAYYVAESEKDLYKELIDYLDKSLPYYMVPSLLCQLESLPKLVNGKIDKRVLEEMQDVAIKDEIKRPCTADEIMLAELWKQVLEITETNIGVDQDFFRLGGQSLKAAKLVYRIKQVFGIEMQVKDIFIHRTIVGQLEYISKNSDNKIVFEALKHADKKDSYGASMVQKRIFYAEAASNTPLYNMPLAFLLRGNVDEEKVRTSLQTILDRHEALRTNLMFDGEMIVQKIWDKRELPFEIREALGGTVNDILAECIRPFSLEKDVLFRAYLYYIGDKEYILFWDMHHCISDGISEEIIKSEFIRLYKGEVLPPPKYQYRDYSEWMLGRKQDNSYWLNELKKGNFSLNLPTDHKRSKDRKFIGSNERILLKNELYRKLINFVENEGLTLYSILLSAMYITLSRYTGQNDIILGTVSSGREIEETEELVGSFISVYAMRNIVKEDENVFSFIRNVYEKTLEMMSHSDYSFNDLLAELPISRSGIRLPLIETMLILQNMDKAIMECEGMTIRPLEVTRGTSKYDLTLYAVQNSEGLLLDMEYSTELFEAETVAKMLDSYETVLNNLVVAARNCSVSAIPVLNSRRKSEILARSNCAEKQMLLEARSVQEKFENRVKLSGERTAITCKGRSISYEELNKRANQLAGKLISEGAARGELVGIMMHRDLDMIASVLAVLKTGCAYVPIDPSYPQERVEYMLSHSKCRLLLTDQESESYDQTPLLKKRVTQISVKDVTINSFPTDNPEVEVSYEDLAYVIYTSGSTGKPKGVMLKQGNVVNFIEAMCREIDFSQDQKILCLTTISFDIFVLETLIPLSQGMEIVLATEDEQLDVGKVGALIRENKVSIMQSTPSRLEMFMENQKAGELLEGISMYLLGGEPVKESTFRKLREIVTGDTEIYDVYGPTETCVWSTIKKLEKDKPITIGKAIGNTRLYVLDKDKNILPDNVVGDLYIGGMGVAKGYLNNPELTEERFVSNPFVEGEIMYCTGDKVRWNSDGDLDFLGRDDGQVKVRGYRVELGEIEESILGDPDVHSCACILKQDKSANENYILAFYSSDSEIENTRLYARVNKNLPFYMIPKDFIYLEKLPSTPNGKVDRKSLCQLQITINTKYDDRHSAKIDFDNPEEEFIWNTWKEVLSREYLGLDDNFFETGGNSLLLVRIFYRIDEKFPEVISQAEMFSNPTIRMTAELIRSRLYVDKEIEKKRMPVAGIRLKEGYKPFIQTGSIKEQELKVLKRICEKKKLEIEEIMFAIYAFIGAKITGERDIYIQCLISDEEGIEKQVDLKETHSFEDLLRRASNAYRKGKEAAEVYRVQDVKQASGRDEKSVFLSYSYNRNPTCSNLELMNMCMCVNADDENLHYRMITNKNCVINEFSEKIFEAFNDTLTGVIIE